jgi:hypothetical protein
MLRLSDPDRQTPALVAALVGAGAEVLEVRPEMPALEDVYLHLMGERSDKSRGSDGSGRPGEGSDRSRGSDGLGR